MGRKHRQKPITNPKGILLEVDCLKIDVYKGDRYIVGFTTSTVRLKNEKLERWLKGKHPLERGMAQCPKCERWNNAIRKVCMYCGVMLLNLPVNQPINEKKPERIETREEKVIRNRQETRFLSKKGSRNP